MQRIGAAKAFAASNPKAVGSLIIVPKKMRER
jgi:hypothetical protein